ncbi:MFS transporter [Paenibacillus sp. N1-5-1-14]|uniref:MFS transporter n=1 Tax=Paenibacillus radicibacter TaxID=2972488 RepID=UPI002158B987|nr:MFS transporter [Paenibacillus radicibacter]MCR8643588.1 MFS transporter [Paenibacillus radicibacter]
MLQRSFRSLWMGQTLSNTADILYVIALVTMMYSISGSATFTALIPLCRVLSQSVGGFLAPLILAKYRLTAVMRLSQTIQLVLFTVLALFAWQFLSPSTLWVVLLIIAIISFFDGWTAPAQNALVPRLVENEKLLKANAFLSTVNQIVQFGGWGIGGVVVAFLSSPPTLALVTALYAIALIFTLQIKDLTDTSSNPASSNQQTSSTSSTKPSRMDSIREGWAALWNNRRLRTIFVMDIIDGLCGAIWIGAFTLVFVQEVLHQNDAWWGFINASYFVGTILGGFIVMALVKKLDGKLPIFMIIGTIGYGVMTMIFAMTTNLILILLIVIAMGPMVQLRTSSRTTLIQRSVSVDLLPKVLSAETTLIYALFGVSVLLCGILIDLWGSAVMYIVAGGISVLAGLIGIVLRKSLQNEELPTHSPTAHTQQF